MDWYVDGRCLYWTIRQYWERYHIPVMVTENGMAAHDAVSPDRKVHDPERIDFLHQFLPGVKRAVEEGIPVLGYQHWSVMDNFEWCEGYGPRFGLIYVDYQTQKRTLKDSAYEYAKIIKTNGEALSLEQILIELLAQIFCVQYLLEILKHGIDLSFGESSAIQMADGITKYIDKDIGISVVSILFERNVLISQPRQVKKGWDLYALVLRSAHPCHLCAIE